MTRVLCPNCGIYHTIPDTFENRIRRPFKADVMAPALPSPSTNYAPAGQPNRETHVAVPFDQAKITGFFAAPLGGVVAYGIVMVIDATPSIEITSWGKVAVTLCGVIVTGFSVAGWMWFRRLGVYDGLLWTVEETTGLDLDGDGEVGELVSEVVRIELTDHNGIPRLIADFNTDRERFTELARLVLEGKGFSEETAKKAGYTRKEWEAIRNKFMELNAATWKNRKHHNQGIDITGRGADIFKGLLPPALPAGDVA